MVAIPAGSTDRRTLRRLETKLQHYDWGDTSFIATLRRRVPSGRPEAELWAGAHRSAPSGVEGRGLDEVIAADPVGTLGADVAASFGALPFLAKFMAAAQPLSLQVHPSAEQAEAGYARERSAGVPADSPLSVYRDRSHKPELICALTAFEARCGFRPVEQSVELFEALDTSALDEVRGLLATGGSDADVLREALTLLLESGPASGLTAAVVAAAAHMPPGSAWFSELRWLPAMNRLHGDDPAIVASLLLNHVIMRPGEALYLGAGTLHSYLVGAGVEVMASSDNVVRAGISNKLVDVPELLRVVDTNPAPPNVQTAEGPVHEFDVPVPDFSVSRIAAPKGLRFDPTGPEILMVSEGSVDFVDTVGEEIAADAGTALWVPASTGEYSATGPGTYYRVGVGLQNA